MPSFNIQTYTLIIKRGSWSDLKVLKYVAHRLNMTYNDQWLWMPKNRSRMREAVVFCNLIEGTGNALSTWFSEQNGRSPPFPVGTLLLFF